MAAHRDTPPIAPESAGAGSAPEGVREAWDVVVVGGANTDFLIRGDVLPRPGVTAMGSDFQEAPGGKGANQATAAARLGARVAFIGCVGQDPRGAAVLGTLTREGVDVTHVARTRSAATGAALIQVDRRGEKQILTAPGANLHLSRSDIGAAAPVLRSARVVLVQLELPLDVVGAAVRLAHGSAGGVKVILDPSPPVPLPDELMRLVYAVRPNADEAEALTGVRPAGCDSARDAAERLLARGPRIASVQAGDAGDLVVWRDQHGEQRECWLPHLPVSTVDATGAGDAFSAALAVMLSERRPIEYAARFANAAAALATTRLGAQAALPRRDAVLALMGRTGRAD